MVTSGQSVDKLGVVQGELKIADGLEVMEVVALAVGIGSSLSVPFLKSNDISLIFTKLEVLIYISALS